MEELLEVVLQRSARQEQLVLQVVGAQNPEELDRARRQSRLTPGQEPGSHSAS